MKRNVGKVDRTIRVLLGIFILSMLFWGPKNPWALIGLLPLGTGLIGWCGPYHLLGINTCKKT